MQRTDIARDWHGKPYYSLDSYCKNTFHHKCYKIALNARMSCPNRDGTLDTRGCIFCSRGGSGDFAVDILGKSMEEQIAEGISNFGNKSIGQDLIAYFQAYTNTYAPLPYLEEVYRSALDHPDICGISIATRPDCLGPEVLALLSRLKNTMINFSGSSLVSRPFMKRPLPISAEATLYPASKKPVLI